MVRCAAPSRRGDGTKRNRLCVMGGTAARQSESGSLKRIEDGACQWKVSGTMSPPMALCWESQAGGVHVGGWSGVQLDHGGEVGPIHGMCGTLGC